MQTDRKRNRRQRREDYCAPAKRHSWLDNNAESTGLSKIIFGVSWELANTELHPQLIEVDRWSKRTIDPGTLMAGAKIDRLFGTMVGGDAIDEGAIAVSQATLERAKALLGRLVSLATSLGNSSFPLPDVNACPDGSIDLHWKRSGFELLMNVPPRKDALVTFYGDDYGDNVIKGSVSGEAGERRIYQWIQP